MKSEKIVLQRIGGEIEKTDLISHSEARALVLNLVKSQTRLLR
jgi:hypothetical protein